MPASSSFPVIRYASVASTNAIALEFARQGGEHGTVVLAEQQSQGRGRGTKSFFSPPGGLYMSVILRPELPAARLPFVTLATGVACARAVEELTGLSIFLKWPNDLYLQERKLGGILAETGPYSAASHSIPFVVLGIGMNVNCSHTSFPPGLRNMITSLYDAKPQHYEIDTLVTAIHTHLDKLVYELRDDYSAMILELQQRDFLLGRDITWQDVRGRVMQGRGAGFREDGCYLLQAQDSSLHAILAGEVIISQVVEQRK